MMDVDGLDVLCVILGVFVIVFVLASWVQYRVSKGAERAAKEDLKEWD